MFGCSVEILVVEGRLSGDATAKLKQAKRRKVSSAEMKNGGRGGRHFFGCGEKECGIVWFIKGEEGSVFFWRKEKKMPILM